MLGKATPTPAIRAGLARLPGYQVSLTKIDPEPNDSSSSTRGNLAFRLNCGMCHSSPENPTLPDPRKNPLTRPRDLARPETYKYGSTDQALYRSILYGIPRTPMGSYQGMMSEQQIWDYIHYIKSTWRRPRGDR
jgi:mono/diheme cytochrome c family protein